MVRREHVVDGRDDRLEELPLLRGRLRTVAPAFDEVPGLGLERDLAALPGPTPECDGRLEDRELVGPRREAALAAEVIQLGEHRDDGVVGGLQRDVLEFVAAQVPEGAATARDLEAGRPQEEAVEPGDGLLPSGAVSRERLEPLLVFRVTL